MNERLDKFDKEKVEHVKKHPLILKKAMSFYNNACRECKQKIINDPTRPVEDYCVNCRRRLK